MDLSPCPECGNQPKLSSLEPEYQTMKYFCSVHCSIGDWKPTEELAAADWNKRVKEYKEAAGRRESMRDLNADLDEWNSDLINGIRSTDWFYLAGEYIERALKAEKKNIESYDLLYGASDKVKDEAEQLKAEQARCELRTMDDDAHYENYYEAKRLLSQPDPGAEIMERMAKLEAVAEAVKIIDEWEDDGKDYGSVLFPQELYYLLMDALDALEGPDHE